MIASIRSVVGDAPGGDGSGDGGIGVELTGFSGTGGVVTAALATADVSVTLGDELGCAAAAPSATGSLSNAA